MSASTALSQARTSPAGMSLNRALAMGWDRKVRPASRAAFRSTWTAGFGWPACSSEAGSSWEMMVRMPRALMWSSTCLAWRGSAGPPWAARTRARTGDPLR